MKNDKTLTLKFEPKTIEHLGVRMYSTLPPALAELVSNAYDADAEKVCIHLSESNGFPTAITIEDNGMGMSSEDIDQKFLVIGRNRRADGDIPSPKFKRKPTGKKGLGKLSVFGLARTITITTICENKKNKFSLDYDELISKTGEYHPTWGIQNETTAEASGTIIELTNLKRKSPFDIDDLTKSLARIFIFDANFKLTIRDSRGNSQAIDNFKKYDEISEEFSWGDEAWKPSECTYPELHGKIISAQSPISPRSGLRGISIYSRGKLVNAPEFFSESTSSHFFQYVTGYIVADFIDLLPEDVISTNRQSIDWEHPEMAKFRKFLAGIVSQVGSSWRKKRKEKKDAEITVATGGIDRVKWMSTLPADIQENASDILNILGNEEGMSKIAPVIKALHNIIPDYPLLHWRHLNPRLRTTVASYYKNNQFGEAAQQGCLDYLQMLREKTGSILDGRQLVDPLFNYLKNKNPVELPKIQVTNLSTESEENIQEGHAHLSRGLVVGFRNPIQHAPMYAVVPKTFTELDCLNVLSLISYLMTRAEGAKINP